VIDVLLSEGELTTEAAHKNTTPDTEVRPQPAQPQTSAEPEAPQVDTGVAMDNSSEEHPAEFVAIQMDAEM